MILASVLVLFAVAAFAPLLQRVARGLAGPILALAPLSVFVWYLSLTPAMIAGDARLESLEWIPGLGIDLSFRVDGLAHVMALLVTGIGTLVVLYASAYLKTHWQLARFYAVLLAFMASMLGVVTADNIFALFVFWELTSLTSYLLIGFDHHKAEARKSALQALLVTGSGGLALLAGLVLLGVASGGVFDISAMAERAEAIRGHELYVGALVLILAGCFTKSAQFPFHFWLPNAMAAPTPVSSYLHSATMVKAGVYLICRLNPIMAGDEGDLWRSALLLFGGTTIFVAGFLALRQVQLKKLLAYSTVASLGVIVFLVGIGSDKAITAAVVFLLAHALYKAALFQNAGNLTHGTGEKEVSCLSGLRQAMPFSGLGGILAGLSMIGVPFLTVGYVGKEMLVAASLKDAGPSILPIAVAMFGGATFVMIGGAVGVRPYFGRRRETRTEPHENPPLMTLGPIVLGVLGVVAGVWITFSSSFGTTFVQPMAEAIAGHRAADVAAEVHAHAGDGHDVSDAAVATVPSEATDTAHAGGKYGPFKVSMWHGFNLVFLLDLVVIALGLVLLFARARVERTVAVLDPVLRYGPEWIYDRLLAGTIGLAKGQTAFLQNGYLRVYLGATLLVLLGLTGWAYVDALPVLRGTDPMPLLADIRVHEALICLSILVGLYAMVRTRSRLVAIGALGLVGYGVAMLFVFFGAPDLAITQFLVETLTVILLVLVFYRLPSFAHFTGSGQRLRDAVIAIVSGGLMSALVIAAAKVNLGTGELTREIAERSYVEAHGRNTVNVILVDFRAIDTLGEIVVLAAAAIGVYALIRLRLEKGGAS